MKGEGINVLSLFDGMSCGQIALRKLRINYKNYYASEIDKFAIKVTQANFPKTVQLGDCQFITGHQFMEIGGIDLLMGGSPCQGFSFAGKQLNFQDPRSALFFEFVRLYRECKPKYFLLENVHMSQESHDVISYYLGVQPVSINSDLFVQQNRPRLYWTNIDIGPLPERPDWDGEFYQWRRTYFRENKSGVSPCLTANMGTGGHNVPLKSKDLKDKLSPEECEAFQGMPLGYTNHVSKTQRYKMIGNGWTVPVIKHILSFCDFSCEEL